MKAALMALDAFISDSCSDLLSPRRWKLFLTSGILATFCAGLTYHFLDLPQHYSELVVGSLSWSFSNKFHDYSMCFSFVAGFLIFVIVLSVLRKLISTRIGEDTKDDLEDFLLVLNTPAGVWFAGLLTTHNLSLRLLVLSCSLLLAALFFAFLFTARPKHYWKENSVRFVPILSTLMLGVLATAFATVAICLGANRIAGILNLSTWLHVKSVKIFILGSVIVFHFAVIGLVLFSRSPSHLERITKRLVFLLQCSFPAFFFILIPTPWLVNGRLIIGYPMSIWAWIVIASCIILAYSDLIRLSRPTKTSSDSCLGMLSLFCTIGIILFLRTDAIPLPSIWPDDYHFGEKLVPWWSLSRHGQIPFIDYSPARGLVNYFPGAIASILFDGKASSFAAVQPFMYTGILLVALPVLAKSIGKGPATLALLLAPTPNGISEIDVFVTVFVSVVCLGFQKWIPRKWIAVWFCFGMAILLFAPGQGALAILATTPLFLIMAYRYYRNEPKKMFGLVLVFGVGIALLSIATPFGKMLWGAIRYGFEQSNVNSIAHGIPWRSSFATSGLNPWLYEIMRFSWLLVSVWAGVLALKALSMRSSSERSTILCYTVPIFIITVLFIIRAAGRIDPGSTRLGVASIWALSLLLPLLLFAALRWKANGTILFAWLSLAGLVYPHFGGLSTGYLHSFEPIHLQLTSTANVVEGSSIGIPALGSGMVDPAHLARLSAIRTVLNKVLTPDETYLDLSGRHAHYFYFDRPPPIEAGSFYNLVTESQQLRSISILNRNPPAAILISAENMVHDGGSASLRSNLLYRYLLLRPDYKVVQVGKQIWLIKMNRMNRISGVNLKSISDVDDSPSNPIHGVFRVSDLRAIPASWGRSFATLKRGMRQVHTISGDNPISLNSAVQLDRGKYLVNGDNPSVSFDISYSHLKGRDVGIVSFSFSCEGIGPPPEVTIHWSSLNNAESELTSVRLEGRNGRMIVPIDAAPAWLLAKEIRSIRFGISDQKSCRVFSIQDVAFFRRRASEVVNQY